MTQTAVLSNGFVVLRNASEQYAITADSAVEKLVTSGLVSEGTGYAYFKGSHHPIMALERESYRVGEYSLDECRICRVETEGKVVFFVLGYKQDEALRRANGILCGQLPHPTNDIQSLLEEWHITIPANVMVTWLGTVPLYYVKRTSKVQRWSQPIRFFEENYLPSPATDQKRAMEVLKRSMDTLIRHGYTN